MTLLADILATLAVTEGPQRLRSARHIITLGAQPGPGKGVGA